MSLVVLQNGAFQADTLLEAFLGQMAQLLGIAVTAGGISALTAMTYRWYVRERVQNGVAVLFGLTVVVLYLGTTTALGQVIGGSDEVLELQTVFKNMAAFGVAGVAAYLGTRVGDRLGTDLFAATARQAVDADVSEIVQTVGRVTSVRLPEEIDDIIGYDPMPDSTKENLANRRFLFPRRLTKDELRGRLVARLKTDYGVGHVDIELGDDGGVEYLAVGSRAAGIGPTLPPSTNAVAIQADPAHAASAGDLVQVWEQAPARRVLTGELRGVAGDVVTVAIDAADTPKLDPETRYKLVTLPVQDRSDREFASLLRAADETMGTATVEAGSSLDGETVGSLPVTIVAITRDDGPPETIPSRDRVLAPGDTLYAIAKPDALRRLEEATAGTGVPEPTASDDAGAVDDAGTEGDAAGATAAGTDGDTAESEGDDTDSRADTGGEDTDDAESDTDRAEAEVDGAADTPADLGGDADARGTDGDTAPATEDDAGLDAADDEAAAAEDDADLDATGDETAAADRPTDTENGTTESDEEVAGLDSLPDAGEGDAANGDSEAATDPLEPLRDASGPDDDVAFDDLVEGDDTGGESSEEHAAGESGDDAVEVWDPDERIGGEVAEDETDGADDDRADSTHDDEASGADDDRADGADDEEASAESDETPSANDPEKSG